MKRFVEGVDRGQSTLLPEYLDDFIDEDNPVRVVDVFRPAKQGPTAQLTHQIPIALSCAAAEAARDFVPWRFSDAATAVHHLLRRAGRPRNLHIN